jgi:DNA anti-recombination protein RmuC
MRKSHREHFSAAVLQKADIEKGGVIVSISWGRSEAHQRHVDDAEQRLERRRRKEQQRSEEQTAIDQLRAELRQEIANLRAEMQQVHDIAIEATGEALGEYGNKICDHLEKMFKELQRDVSGEVARKFGEAMGRIDALTSGAPSRSRPTKDFRFANEADAVDLPNPLVRKTTMN